MMVIVGGFTVLVAKLSLSSSDMPSDKLMGQIKASLVTGDFRVKIAEEWFAFWRFIVITAIFHTAAAKTGYWPLIGLKWACYLFAFAWAEHKINRLLWILSPSCDPAGKRKIAHVSAYLQLSNGCAMRSRTTG